MCTRYVSSEGADMERFFRLSKVHPWALAGLWNTWTDPETGEFIES